MNNSTSERSLVKVRALGERGHVAVVYDDGRMGLQVHDAESGIEAHVMLTPGEAADVADELRLLASYLD